MKDLIALKKVSLFSNLSLEQLAVIDRAMVTRKFKSGEKLFSTGEKSDELYVILEGDVEIQLGEESQIIVLATLGQNDVLGEMAPLTDKPRSANAVALTPTVTRVLRKDRLGAILKDHPELLLGIVKDLSQRLIAANAHLQEKAKP